MNAVVIGGGPAGLMAADALLSAGIPTILAEAKPSVARKFLMAGKSGLNLSKMEPFETFLSAYAEAAPALRPMLQAFGPEDVLAWAEGLNQPCFTGSSGRLFPVSMKGSPLLRAWLGRLDELGLERKTRWRWTGWAGQSLSFETPTGPQFLAPELTILALGGASWSRLGSDGAWADIFENEGLQLTPFAPANAALTVQWSDHMRPHFGRPLKNVVLRAGALENRGETTISARGLEGGGLYPLTPATRGGHALTLDLLPDVTQADIAKRLAKARGKQSLSNTLRKALRLTPAAQALLMEMGRPLPNDTVHIAELVKNLPLRHSGLRPMDEAISTAGGVPFGELDKGLMLKKKPGVFCAGEMLDWEAPTGGFLLTACLATGLWAGRSAVEFSARNK